MVTCSPLRRPLEYGVADGRGPSQLNCLQLEDDVHESDEAD